MVGRTVRITGTHLLRSSTEVTAHSLASISGPTQKQRRRIVPPSALPFLRWSGLFIVAAIVVVIELAGRPAALDPALLLPVAVLAATVLGGLSGGAIAGVVGGLYVILYYSQPSEAAVPAGWARVGVSLAASVVAGWIALLIERRSDVRRRATDAAARRNDQIAEFAGRLANETLDKLPSAIVDGASHLMAANLAVLTVLDPPSGRHFVRAMHGGGGTAVGIEVLPGVGISGQAIRDRRLVVAAADPTSMSGLSRRLEGKSVAQSMAAAVGLQTGRVITSVTVGRADGARFDAADLRMLEQIVALATLSVAGSLARNELEEGALRDQLTGLYNRAYLDAVLAQTTAWRRRTSPEQRPPLAMIMFDIDSFAVINERQGRQVGDQVLRAVATLLRQRFRASDVIARVGSDSFLVVLNGATGDTASEAAAQIRRQVRELNIANARGEPVVVSISAGCALLHDGDQADALFRSVEAALETARWSGSGAVVSI